LSHASDVSVPTIKYYLREGLLPAGEPTAANQARYDETHLHRLRLIRVLRTVADLPIATIGQILAAVDDQEQPLHHVLGVAHAALNPPPAPEDQLLIEAQREVDAWLGQLGWRVSAQAPARGALAHALASLRQLGREHSPQALDIYAEAADRVAAWELDRLAATDTREEQVENVVVGTVLYEAVLTALRRLAQEHHSTMRFDRKQP
jgi:DNA-binding transcriptional MerR regulator